MVTYETSEQTGIATWDYVLQGWSSERGYIFS